MDNVVLLSGGMDSAVALAMARDAGSVMAVTFDYGQANRGELNAARRLAEHYNVSQRVVVVDYSFATGACAALGGSDITHTFVPARNLLFLSYGVAVAEAFGAHMVWFGANKDDHEYYPDTRPTFARVMDLAADLGTKEGGIRIVAPFMRMTKAEVARLGESMMVPLSWTTTCAQPKEGKPCGVCRGCKQREACGA